MELETRDDGGVTIIAVRGDLVIGDASLVAAERLPEVLGEMVRVAAPNATVAFNLATASSYGEFFSIYWEALGNAFGSLKEPPYVQLDQDDRSGQSTEGENLFINMERASDLKRILVYAFIYEGVPTWSEADAVVTVRQQGGQDIVVRLDETGQCAGQ